MFVCLSLTGLIKDRNAFSVQKPIDPKVLEDQIITLARNALKPHYHKGAITSQEFKLIMRKAIQKVRLLLQS